MSLQESPCFAEQCYAPKDQLAVLVLLLGNATGNDFDYLLNSVIPTHRGMTQDQARQHLIAAFTDEQRAAITPEALACYRCLSQQQLEEMYTYLVEQLIALLRT